MAVCLFDGSSDRLRAFLNALMVTREAGCVAECTDYWPGHHSNYLRPWRACYVVLCRATTCVLCRAMSCYVALRHPKILRPSSAPEICKSFGRAARHSTGWPSEFAGFLDHDRPKKSCKLFGHAARHSKDRPSEFAGFLGHARPRNSANFAGGAFSLPLPPAGK